MLSSGDLERLIAVKKREIQSEKTSLGLTPPREPSGNENKENSHDKKQENKKSVNFDIRVLSDSNGRTEELEKELQDVKEIPPDLERYIRRYIGLPTMLKAGEFSPNNPLARTQQTHARDGLLGLGEYERRNEALRRLRQREYRECLLQQAKKKQEAKEREVREERERDQIVRQRELDLLERDGAIGRVERVSEMERGRRDTAVQVVSGSISVAVQTDDDVLRRLSPQQSPTISQKLRAERELSPRTVQEGDTVIERRKHYGDYDDRSNEQKCKDRLMTDLRHSYMPSIFDSDAIRMRNIKAEQEAAAKRQSYQQELKNQIQEQQRLKEERKAREKLLEQAEMRRLEEQLKMLKVAQEREVGKNQQIITAMAENAKDYEKKRKSLQNEIDFEKQSLLRSFSQPTKPKPQTKRSDSKLPDRLTQSTIESKTFSTNIPQNSLFSSQYDVDSYLRRNLNPKRNSIFSDISSEINTDKRFSFAPEKTSQTVEAQIHTPTMPVRHTEKVKTDSNYEPSFLKKDINDLIKNVDDTPIPVLRHPISPKINIVNQDGIETSEAMKKVEDKWKVPIVQKNILKTLPSEGKNVSILTQLGSIRRQLQLEQLRLDKKLYNDDLS